MKVIPFKIPKSSREFVRFQEDKQAYFYDKLHQHPEIQLSCLLEGEGKLIVGDYLGRFQPGELYLLGRNVPHVFRSDQVYYAPENQLNSHSMLVFFDTEAVGHAFWETEEMQEARRFLDTLNGCYRLKGIAKESLIREVQQLKGRNGLDKVLGGLQILNMLMQEATLERLNLDDRVQDLSEREGRRMDRVLQFLVQQSQRAIPLEEAAAVASLSKEAFCRFFKERTRKTFTAFLNEMRISNACQLLLKEETSVASVAYEVGFSNLSHFNRVFKNVTGVSPRAYRKGG
ncbi:helix-turn-helix transcriptional regulator [Pontibacter sp. JH31]|uniref:Helix-turn-helix transcriptional regulator n=1 Tax=Pontibacter aquaedesilientis TaxID=2766980 RepID=A0ABR7XDM7_9BACT|nr:AraC family transcriptional regulator [Pontibacter aquaedesilientis]MBD1396397.1 helix-turn-helix transcriptional regulator [Pontibacter aquaedesilientis]